MANVPPSHLIGQWPTISHLYCTLSVMALWTSYKVRQCQLFYFPYLPPSLSLSLFVRWSSYIVSVLHFLTTLTVRAHRFSYEVWWTTRTHRRFWKIPEVPVFPYLLASNFHCLPPSWIRIPCGGSRIQVCQLITHSCSFTETSPELLAKLKICLQPIQVFLDMQWVAAMWTNRRAPPNIVVFTFTTSIV